jgi:hypothetical protein
LSVFPNTIFYPQFENKSFGLWSFFASLWLQINYIFFRDYTWLTLSEWVNKSQLTLEMALETVEIAFFYFIEFLASFNWPFKNELKFFKGNDHLIEFQLIEIVIFQLIESFNN